MSQLSFPTIRVISDEDQIIRIVSEGPQGGVGSLPNTVVLRNVENVFSAKQTFTIMSFDDFGGYQFEPGVGVGTGYMAFRAAGVLENEEITYVWPLAPSAYSGPSGDPGWLLSTDENGNMSWASMPARAFYSSRINQALTGTIDGANLVFGFGSGLTVIADSVAVYRNGQRLSLTTDYAINYTTKEITFVIAPVSGESLLVDLVIA